MGNLINEKKIKTLQIFSGVGGGISSWIRKAVIYSNNRYSVDAMAFEISNKANFCRIIEESGGKCITMPRVRSGIINLIKFIRNAIAEEDYDVIHCHIDGYAGMPMWIAATLCKKPIIFHSHRTAIEKIVGKKNEKKIYALNRMVNRIFARNKVACGLKAAEFSYGKNADVTIIYNGVDPIKEIINNKSDKSSEINLLALGRLNLVKNHKFMIKVSYELKKANIPFHLYIVGDGELKEDIEKKIVELDLKDVVTLEGYCDYPEVYLTKCDSFLMPSFSEGLPTVMLEAQKYGCNILAHNVITKECDLEIGLVQFMEISDMDCKKWVEQIITLGHKKPISSEKINNALKKKRFINSVIYDEYERYIRKLIN